MSKKDRATVFHTAFNNMSKHYRVLEGSPSDLAKKTGVGVSTISDYQKGTSNMDFSTMERILLNDIVSEKALDFFIEQLKNLLQASRNSQDKEDEDSRGDDCSDLENPVPSTIETGEGLQQSWYRTGQKGFSDNVCANYSNCCCFPNCFIDEHTFLIGAHIARWVDVEELRGDISNGLCLCLMHDKAFESGFFTLTKDLRVAVNKNNQIAMTSKWCKENLIPYDGDSIHIGSIKPSLEALREHWERICFTPDS